MRTAHSARIAATLHALKPIGSLMSPYVKGVTTAKACTRATQRPCSVDALKCSHSHVNEQSDAVEACALYGFI